MLCLPGKLVRKKLLVLDSAAKIHKVIKDFPIEDVWGIGRQYYDKLTEMGLVTAKDFRQLKPDLVRQYMTVQGWRLHQELWGKPCNVIKEVADRSKGIGPSQSFNTYQPNWNRSKKPLPCTPPPSRSNCASSKAWG